MHVSAEQRYDITITMCLLVLLLLLHIVARNLINEFIAVAVAQSITDYHAPLYPANSLLGQTLVAIFVISTVGPVTAPLSNMIHASTNTRFNFHQNITEDNLT